MMDFQDIEKLQGIIDDKNEEISRLKKQLKQAKLKADRQLQELHDYYDNILAVMPGHVHWLDRNNIFLGCNDLQARDAHLPSRKDIVGKTYYDLPWKDKAEELSQINNQVMETGEPHTSEEYSVLANGMTIYLSQKTALRDNKNNTIGVLNVAVDITERKKMEAALRRAKEAAEVANHMKTEFIANMSHDLHTPLSGIVGLASVLEDKLQDRHEACYAQWISESAKQLLHLLNIVLEQVSDDSLKESEVHAQCVDLREDILGLVQLVRPTAEMKQLGLSLNIDPAVPDRVITDGTKLQRILLNLLGNAIKFSNQGSVSVEVQVVVDSKDYVQLKFTVNDTGIGISEALHTRVFERFYRVNPSYKGTYGGHGVGLHIAQNYVGLLGGEIQIKSSPGMGSSFYFTLPMKVVNESEFEALQSNTRDKLAEFEPETVQSPYNSSPLLLLVEANIVALRFIEAMAIKLGCRFTSATDAAHALQLIKTNNFDFIFTDMELPGGSGLELIEQIRKAEVLADKKQTPIIGLTGHQLEEVEEAYFKTGLTSLVAKPVQLSLMQELLAQFSKLNQ